MQNKQLSAIEAKLEQSLPPKIQDAYGRILAAGLKIMFNPASNKKIFAGTTQGDIPTRLALVTAAVINIISQESRRTMPVDAAIPAAITLYLNALDFLASAGALSVDGAVVQSGITELKGILEQQLQVGAQQGAQKAAQTQGAAPGAAPMPQAVVSAAQQPAPAGGLLGV